MRMDCANLQLAYLADADNRIAPEEYGSLHAGFSVAVLHRRLAELTRIFHQRERDDVDE